MREIIGTVHRTHGMANSRTWIAWRNLRYRCTKPDNNRFDSYAGRGITVCKRWLKKFENFFADMGGAPGPEYSIERIDNNGNYEPGNCRWATAKEQARNRRTTFYVDLDGKRASLAEHAEVRGANYKRVWKRIRNGASPQRAFAMEIRQ